MNIQNEVQKIHHKYGTSEMANYKIQLLCEKYHEEKLNQLKDIKECGVKHDEYELLMNYTKWLGKNYDIDFVAIDGFVDEYLDQLKDK